MRLRRYRVEALERDKVKFVGHSPARSKEGGALNHSKLPIRAFRSPPGNKQKNPGTGKVGLRPAGSTAASAYGDQNR
jgi:hypothetical protein